MILRLIPVVLWLAVRPSKVLTQGPVPITFQTDPVLVQTGTEIVFTVETVTNVLVITWSYPGGSTPLGLWAGGAAVVNAVPQYQGRVTITATQLRIANAQLRDAGRYMVQVDPSAATMMASSSRSVLLRVFDAVAGVSLSVPPVALEGTSVSLNCTWTAGTNISVQWGKGGSALQADSRISISAGSLVINPAARGDAGVYTCTVSNPVSALTATQSLTIYYGPDTPVLTTSGLADCVGGGNAVVGQTVQLTCVSASLPPALFTWQQNGQPVASSQSGSGVLTVQPFTTNQSQYTCVAKNAITGLTSTQGTSLTAVGTCLSGGAVAGIVIACVIALLLIIVAIVLLLRWRNVNKRLNSMQKSNRVPVPVVPEPLPNDERASGQDQSSHPPFHNRNTRTAHPSHLYTLPLDANRNTHIPLHGGPSPNPLHAHTNGLPQDTPRNANADPHNGTPNPNATATAAPPNANTLPQPLQQNPNIVIQTGNGQAGDQPATVHVSLNTLPQPNSQGPQPTVHVNLHSYPTNGQRSQPPHNGQPENTSRPANDTSAPPNSTPQNVSDQLLSTLSRMQSGPSYPGDPQQSDRSLDPGPPAASNLVPTAYTHSHRSNTVHRNGDSQTLQGDQEPGSRGRRSNRADADAGPWDVPPGGASRLRQMPWDRIRGTPAYPNNASPTLRLSSGDSSDSTDYTSQPATQQARNPPRSGPGAWRRSPARGSATQPAHLVSRQAQTIPSVHGSGLQGPDTRSMSQPHGTRPTPISPRAQRESAQQGIRALLLSHTAPGHAPSRLPWRQAPPPSSLPLSPDLPVASGSPQGPIAPQGATVQQGPTVLQGLDSRALADPNHLSSTHVMAQQSGLVQTQTTLPNPAGRAEGQQNATLPDRVAGPAAAKPNSSPLTQAALQTHTQNTHNPFRNRNQQTQAALLHPGPEAQATIPVAQGPPIPPPVIPLAQFRTIPKDRSQDHSPNLVPQPFRTPVNVPQAQRHPHTHNRPIATHANAHPGHVHTHANAHKPLHAHRHTGQPAHPRQQQTKRHAARQ